MKNYRVEQRPAMMVAGIECRTSNAPDAAPKDIPKLWDTFYREQVSMQIPNKVSNDVIVLYCDYEGDHTKPYSCVIGCQVGSMNTVPEGMVAKRLPETSYAIFRSIGEQPKSVVETWGQIWKTDLPRTYTGDYEVYRDMAPKEVEVCIAIGKKS